MDIRIAKAIMEAADMIGGFDFTLREDVSVRGYGEKTANALVYSEPNALIICVAQAASTLTEKEAERDGRFDDPCSDALTLEEFLMNLDFKYDNIGHNRMAY